MFNFAGSIDNLIKLVSKMNKIELVNVMAEKTGLTKVDVKKTLDAFISTAAEAIKNGERISMVGFGTMTPTTRPARKGRNPQTGKDIIIAERKIVKFKPSAELTK